MGGKGLILWGFVGGVKGLLGGVTWVGEAPVERFQWGREWEGPGVW